MSTVPHQFAFLHSETDWPGRTNNPEIDRILDEMGTVKSEDQLRNLNHQLHEEVWNDLPVINIGNFYKVTGFHNRVKGCRNFFAPFFGMFVWMNDRESSL